MARWQHVTTDKVTTALHRLAVMVLTDSSELFPWQTFLDQLLW